MPALAAGPGTAVIFCAPGGRDALASGLRGKGWEVLEAMVYERVPLPADPGQVAARGPLGHVVIHVPEQRVQVQHDRGLVGSEWTPLGSGETAGMVFAPIPTAPGDAVFFDSFAPHRSGPNLTRRPRRALYITYNAAAAGDQRARYFAEKRRSFPPDVARQPGETYVFRV